MNKTFQNFCAALSTVVLLCASLNAHALPSKEAQAKALDALTLDFARYGLTASAPVLAQKYAAACDAGYTPACSQQAWHDVDVPVLARAAASLQSLCTEGDPVACLVVAWHALDEPPASDVAGSQIRAARTFRAQCDAGQQASCYEFGRILYENIGVKADPLTATYRWQPACNTGHTPSCTALARAYQVGDRIRRDAKKARELADKACALRDPDACFVLGQLDRSEWSDEETDTWFGRLCTDGHSDACSWLAQRYVRGDAPEPSPGRILDLLVAGCDLRNGNACYEAARAYQIGTEADPIKAYSYFHDACAVGDVRGCVGVVEMIEAKTAPATTLKLELAAYENACSQRNLPIACERLGTEYLRGDQLPRDLALGRSLLTKVCLDDSSPPSSCMELGRLWEQGVGGDRDRTVAVERYKWACRAGIGEACKLRGDLLHVGVGVSRNDPEALEMYELACAGGYAEGCRAAAVILDEATVISRDPARALGLFAKACEGGSGAGCTGQGLLLQEGAVDGKDWSGARAAYERAVSLGNVDANRLLSYVLFNGIGGKRDRKRARALAASGCQAGDRVACKGAEFMVAER